MKRVIAAGGCILTTFIGVLLAIAHTPAGSNAVPVASAQSGQWRVTHYGMTTCRCTDRLAASLAERRKGTAYVESLVRLEPGHIPPGIHGVPWLVVSAPDGRIAYAGGYDAEPVWEQAILPELFAGRPARPRGIAGCATGRKGLRGEVRRKLQEGL